jgi:hypothetical protein
MLREAFFVQPGEFSISNYESSLINHLFESSRELSGAGAAGSGPD